MTPDQRAALEAHYSDNARRVTALLAGPGAAGCLARSATGGWSAIECIVHLNLTAAATVPRIEAAVREARAAARPRMGRSRTGWMAAMLRWALEPGRFRMPTGPGFEPAATGSPGEVLAEFDAWRARISAVMREAEGLNLTRAVLVSPFNTRLRYNAYAALLIVETHERRHLAQAERAAQVS